MLRQSLLALARRPLLSAGSARTPDLALAATGLVPSWRATRVDPLVALRTG